MELGTVGAILTYVIRLGGHSVNFYEQAASTVVDTPSREVYLFLAEAKRKR